MFRSITDIEHGLVIGLFSGDHNSDDDYQRYVDSLVAAIGALGSRPGIGALIVERGNPIPNAQWRKRIADATGDLGSADTLFILCSADPIIRGVSTAITWLRPPKYELQVVRSTEALLELVRARRPLAAARATEIVRDLQRAPG